MLFQTSLDVLADGGIVFDYENSHDRFR